MRKKLTDTVFARATAQIAHGYIQAMNSVFTALWAEKRVDAQNLVSFGSNSTRVLTGFTLDRAQINHQLPSLKFILNAHNDIAQMDNRHAEHDNIA